MTCPPQINTYAVVGKETGGQRKHHDVCYVAAAFDKKAQLGMKIKPVAFELCLAEGIS